MPSVETKSAHPPVPHGGRDKWVAQLGRRISVAVVGLGKMAQLKYLPYLARHPGVQLTALCDVSSDLARAVGQRYHISSDRCVSDIRQLSGTELDLIFILNHDHADVTARACHFARYVFVEKPLAWDTGTGQHLIAEAQSAGAKIAVGYMRRHDPAVQELIPRMNTQDRPLFVRARNWAGGPTALADGAADVIKPPNDERAIIKRELAARWNTFLDHRVGSDRLLRAGTVALLQLGVHQLNLLRFAFGSIDDVRDVSVHPTSDATVMVICRLNLKGGIPCDLSVTPAINGPWSWCEDIDLVLPNALERIVFGNPFLPTNLATSFRTDGREDRVRSPLPGDVFQRQIADLLTTVAQAGEPTISAAEAVEDIATVETMIDTLHRNRANARAAPQLSTS